MSIQKFLFFFFWGVQSCWKTIHFIDCNLLLLLQLSLSYPIFPEELWLRVHGCVLRILPMLKAQWKTGGPPFTYYHGTEVKPKDQNKIRQIYMWVLSKLFFLSAEIITARHTSIVYCRSLQINGIYLCFVLIMAFWLNYVFFIFCCIVMDHTHVSNLKMT